VLNYSATSEIKATYSLLCLVDANATCSPVCGGHSCWGPGDDQCVHCPHYRHNVTRVCLQSCDEEPLLYADDSAPQKQCRPCHPQCLNSCIGPVTVAYYPVPDRSEDGVLFSIDFFVYIFVSLFLNLFARLRENGWTDLHHLHEIFREGAE